VLAYNASNAVLKSVSKCGDDQEPSKRANPVAAAHKNPHNYADFLFVPSVGSTNYRTRKLFSANS
jgi:hypothetical protein